MSCGQVMEENIIVNEVSFSETAGGGTVADGFNVGKSQARLNTRQRFGNARSSGGEPRETAIANGHRKISQVAHQMNIRQQYIEQAQRYYNLAIINDFTRGRRIANVAAACLYIVCRLNKIPKLLIDFSEALSVNVYILGNTFLKLLRTLALEDPVELPLVDPVLYISSYAAKLDFEPSSIMGVIHTATELVGRMKRDWLSAGRRPSGICAACLFIAARMHGYNRTIREIIHVVKICEQTVKKRLEEFKETPTSQITVADFDGIFLGEAMDPPSFTRARKRDKELEAMGEEDSDDEEDVASKRQKLNPKLNSPGNAEDIERAVEDIHNLMDDEVDANDLKNVLGLGTVPASVPNESLLMLDVDVEIQNALLSESEIAFKTKLWTEVNKDWILKDAQRKSNQSSEEAKPKRIRQRKLRENSNPVYDSASAPDSAQQFINSKKGLSKKIDYSMLESALSFDIQKARDATKSPSVGPNPDSITGFGSVSINEWAENERGNWDEKEEWDEEF
ncbi:transcription factor TFIIIB subunit brf1 [Nowakowskiella sp. JEL0407]|nr:transcription factor TFIIIB subunit brf1 [Nowakowskiella sp. JEL0407]